MKIYSKGNEATITFVTQDGIVFTVGHFYRGEPVLIEKRIPVKTITIAKVMDYYIGISPLKIGSTINFSQLDYDMPIRVEGNTKKYGRVLKPISERLWLTNVPVVAGESGSPVLDENDAIIAYVTHGYGNLSVIMPLVIVHRNILDAIEKGKQMIGIAENTEQSEAAIGDGFE